VLDSDLPAARAATPYARGGDGPWHVILALAMAGLGAVTWRRRGRNSG
jgi:apolipoprotein N-acyltransferase